MVSIRQTPNGVMIRGLFSTVQGHPRVGTAPTQARARAMSLRRAAARGAHIAWKCAATPSARTWRPLEMTELACASRELARCRRGPRNFASSPIEDSDIFGLGGSQGIDTYTSKGFVIGGVEYQGNVFLYQELSLMWGVKTVEEITPDALVAAHVVDPAPRYSHRGVREQNRSASSGDARVFETRKRCWRC